MKEIHQFLPYLRRGDAAGNHALELQRWLLKVGPSEIFVEQADPSVRSLSRHYTEFVPSPDRTALYHAAIGSVMTRSLMAGSSPLVVDYHNVTPAHFLAPYDPRAASLTLSGRIEIAMLSSRTTLAVGHSEYSRRELDEMEFRNTITLPVLLDLAEYEHDPDPRLLKRLQSSKSGADLIFVGRVSPHKRQEDVIKAFYAYKTSFDAGARLFLVGGGSSEKYEKTLRSFIERLELKDVYLTGAVSTPELVAYYRSSDVLVSMSEHEGFWVPGLEAMKFGIPIVAFASSAVPETLGNAGLLVAQKDYAEIAQLIDRVVNDSQLRESLVRSGAERLNELDPHKQGSRYLDALTAAL